MSGERPITPDSAVLVDGPWTHRDISANGVRLHIAEAGTGPLVLLLHGFPEFWWSWRHQLVALAADVAGIVRALGEPDAVVVGHDWGGQIAWSVAALHPAVVRRLVVLSTPHPLRWLASLRSDSGQRKASGFVFRFQLPWAPERWLVEDDARNVAELLHSWGGPTYPDAETERRCRDAMQILYAPNRALEYYRWAFRSTTRTDGRRYRRTMATPITAPTLQLHGAVDPCVLPAAAKGSERYVDADYQWRLIEACGHFPHEEAAGLVTAELIGWCGAS